MVHVLTNCGIGPLPVERNAVQAVQSAAGSSITSLSCVTHKAARRHCSLCVCVSAPQKTKWSRREDNENKVINNNQQPTQRKKYDYISL